MTHGLIESGRFIDHRYRVQFQTSSHVCFTISLIIIELQRQLLSSKCQVQTSETAVDRGTPSLLKKVYNDLCIQSFREI